MTLEEAAAMIEASVESATDDWYVEVRRNAHEVILGGNRQGLLWLAAHCLHLALHGQPGSHIHLDEVGTVVCEQPVIIRHSLPQTPNDRNA